HEGAASSPSLIISTPSDVWLKISRGELSGQEAMMQGLYNATGDISLLLKMDNLFKPAAEVSYEAPPGQRPAGPIPLPGIAWMQIAFLPWMIHWITFDIPGVSHWISVGLPLFLAALIVGYRLAFRGTPSRSPNHQSPNYQPPTWLEWGGLGFFVLAGVLTLTDETGFAVWGSVVSSVVMAALWLGTLLFADEPLSANYSKWGYVKALWRNSLFIYPNAVISLMWGYQFIVAALLGAAAILLPNMMVVFTITRYLLLVPAFIFTSVYQSRAVQSPISNYASSMARLRFWAGMGLSAVSGLLLAASMPNFDVGLLGWLALVPLVATLTIAPAKQHYLLALPFGMVWSIAVHNWYPNIFPPALGYFLIIAVGTFYAGIIQLGVWLQGRLPGALKLLALPVTWAAIEFVKFVAPVVEDWWFVLLAKSQWRFPPALQILSVTGFPGLSFLVMLANVALAFLLLHCGRNQVFSEKPGFWACVSALAVVALIVVWGAVSLPSPPTNTFTIAALTDMVNQDPAIGTGGESSDVGYVATTPEMSQAIFDVDAALTHQAAGQHPAFIVWPENEFAQVTDAGMMTQLGALATEINAYIVADVVSTKSGRPVADFSTADDLYDTAILYGPDGNEVGQRPKINITGGEAGHGFIPGPRTYPVFDTPYGSVGIGVCWDRHRLFIVRELARNGAQIILMPADDDFEANAWFPAHHASDTVFRAAENRLAFATGTTSGLSVVVDPYGRIVAEGGVNERGVIVGETFTVPGQTLYTRWGDWFGWLTVILLLVAAG
ncbi:MAG: nitrilase-related carbon-nitrogen hydrolase, partial [Chloroflexota bacterium]|nr:nitrilase-related carbon-nitrogen hydrolase [Chloroflexota bacterium]